MSGYQKAKGISWTKMDDHLVVLDTRDKREFHEFDEVATFLWEALDSAKSFDDLVASLISVYEVEPEIAKEDTQAFLDNLSSKNLLD